MNKNTIVCFVDCLLN